MKNKDVFEKLFAELSEEFPTLAQVLLKERDIYLASFLKEAVQQRVLMPNGGKRFCSTDRFVSIIKKIKIFKFKK